MKKLIFYILLAFFFTSPVLATTELDSDSNGALDVDKGGTNISVWETHFVDGSESDQGGTASGSGETIYDVAQAVGTTKRATIVFRHTGVGATTTYTLDTSFDGSSYRNLYLKFEPGAILSRSTGDEVLTVYSPENIIAQTSQTLTELSMLAFAQGGDVYPEWWGADGDGTTDDTTPIQAAIDCMESSTGRVVLHSRTYVISNIVIESNDVEIIGRGPRQTTLEAVAGTTGEMVRFEGTATGNHIFRNSLKNLRINGSSIASLVGLEVRFASFFTMDNVYVENCLGDATYWDEVWDSWIWGGAIRDNGASGKAGIYIYSGASDNCNNLRFYGTHLENNIGYDIHINSAGAGATTNNRIIFDAVKMEEGTGSGTKAIYVTGGNNEDITFRGCTVAGYNDGVGMHWDSAGNSIIDGCNFWNSSSGGSGIDLDDGYHTIVNNTFYNWTQDIDITGHSDEDEVWMWMNKRQTADGRLFLNSSIAAYKIQQVDRPVVVTFTDGDTTPDVMYGTIFETANTSPTTITALEAYTQGKRVVVIMGDSNTTWDFTGTTLHGNTGADWSPDSGDWMECVYNDTDHYCSVHDTTP